MPFQAIIDADRQPAFHQYLGEIPPLTIPLGSVPVRVAQEQKRKRNLEFHQYPSISNGTLGTLRAPIPHAFHVVLTASIEMEQVNAVAHAMGNMFNDLMKCMWNSEIKFPKFLETKACAKPQECFEPITYN